MVGEVGGAFESDEDKAWQEWAVDYLTSKHMPFFYSSLTPKSEGGGLLSPDYSAPWVSCDGAADDAHTHTHARERSSAHRNRKRKRLSTLHLFACARLSRAAGSKAAVAGKGPVVRHLSDREAVDLCCAAQPTAALAAASAAA